MCFLRLTDFDVFGSVVRQPLVHLIADAQHVVFDAQICDHLELLGLVNLSWTCMRVSLRTTINPRKKNMWNSFYRSFIGGLRGFQKGTLAF